MHPVHILLIEDNEGDIVLLQEALSETKLSVQLSCVRDGEDAISFLQQGGKYTTEKWPDMILLDINLPKIDGKEVLKFIKTNPGLAMVPVIILTTSSSEKDMQDAYANHADCFIKPVSLESFVNVVDTIEDFWSRTLNKQKLNLNGN
jgi:two-component system, chemotaxis family, response regulator Rcp1